MDVKVESEGDSRVASPETAGAITNDNSDADGGEDDGAELMPEEPDIPVAASESADTFSIFDSLLELGGPGDVPL
jgi:hypothetical protein